MVQGVEKVRRQLAAVPQVVADEVRASLQASAQSLVAQMNTLKPSPKITVGWEWTNGIGLGSGVSVRTYKNPRTGKTGQYGIIAIRVFAVGPQLNSRIRFNLAQAFEFGTDKRRQVTTGRKTGAMDAQPYFYPAYRANKRAIRSRVSAAVRRAAKQLNAT